MLSLLLGFASSLLPKVTELWKDTSDKKHELELLKLNAEIQDKAADRAFDVAVARAQGDVFTATQQTDATNLTRTHAWVNDLNGIIRPMGAIFAYALMGFVVYHSLYGDIDVAGKVLGIPLLVETTQFIIGFWFGNRSFSKVK